MGPRRRAKYLKSGINQAAGQRLRPATWILRVGMLNFDGYSCRSCECIIHSGAKPTHARYSVRVALRPQALCRAPKKHCSLECQCLSTTACSLSKQITKLAARYQPLRLSKSVFCWESCGHDAKHHQPRLPHPVVCMRERGTSKAKVDTWLAGLKACRESWAATTELCVCLCVCLHSCKCDVVRVRRASGVYTNTLCTFSFEFSCSSKI